MRGRCKPVWGLVPHEVIVFHELDTPVWCKMWYVSVFLNGNILWGLEIPLRKFLKQNILTLPWKCEALTWCLMPRPTTANLPMWYGQKAKTKMNSVLSDTTQNTCSKNTREPSRPSNRSHVSSSAARSHSKGFTQSPPGIAPSSTASSLGS